MMPSIRRLVRRLRRRTPVQSTLTHREAMRLLVDYNFGRLSPQQSAAVEAHVRACATCRREGLDHAPTESYKALQRLQSVRGVRLSGGDRRSAPLIALLCVAAALAVLGTLRLGPGLLKRPPSPSPTPAPLIPHTVLALDTAGARGIVGDPRGQLLAVAGAGSTSTITLWQASSGLDLRSLTWTGSGVPAMMSWSPDGRLLAATDGVAVAVWSVRDGMLAWATPLPAHASAAVFDGAGGQVVSQPDLSRLLAQQAFLAWGSNGTLEPAQAGAQAPTNAAAVNGLLVGMWRMGGTYLFPLPGGKVGVGSRATDAPGSGDLDWSPDGDYLLWSRVVQPVALPGANGSTPAQGAPPPDEPLATVAMALAARGSGDALAWFDPSGRALALCDRSGAGAALQIVDLSSSRTLYSDPNACDQLTATSATWLAASTTFVVAPPNHPVQEFSISLPSS